MQDFELESPPMGVDHSQKVKATPIGSDYSSKDCINLLPSTAVSRFNRERAGTGRETARLYTTHYSTMIEGNRQTSIDKC